MNASLAASKADHLLVTLIANQPSLAGANVLLQPANALALAANLAAMRAKLVEELTKQAD